MIDLPLALVAGLLGSAHCVGMCGGFALSVGAAAEHWRANLARQLAYSSGRLATYTFAGAAAGYFGLSLAGRLAPLVNVQAVLAIVAGGLLVVQGLATVGAEAWLRGVATADRRRLAPRMPLACTATGERGEGVLHALVSETGPSAGGNRAGPLAVPSGQMGYLPLPVLTAQPPRPCLGAALFGGVLRIGGTQGAFLAGLATGFLPCGLLYAMLALAAASQSLWLGLSTMAAFGLGTVPLLVATGCGGSLLGLAARRRALQAAAWCVVLAGGLSLARGIGFLDPPGPAPPAGCPACAAENIAASLE